MRSTTNILYILGFFISVSIWSAFGLFSKNTPLDSNQLFIFLFSLLIIPFPNFILMFRERIYDSVIKGDTKKITSFIKRGNINKKNSYGKSLLHYAILRRKSEIINLLIKNQANIDIKDNEGNTPLHLATYYGYFSVVKLLLENGACVNLHNDKGQTPLNLLQENYFLTISQEVKNDIINLLKDYGAK